VWDACDRWIGIEIIKHEHLDLHMLTFHLLGLNLKVYKAWKGMWIAIMSEIWNHRSKVVFRNGKVDDIEIFFSKHN